MIPLFPTPYPDELLYSIVARYQFWSRNKFYGPCLKDLFNNPYISMVVDFPGNMAKLTENLDSSTVMDIDYFIFNHTYFPLIMPFIPKERHNVIYGILKNSKEKGMTVVALLGLRNLRLTNQFLMYCPECYKFEQEQYGEAYWHSIHQLNGITVCPHHKTVLLSSEIDPTYWTRKLKVIDINQIPIPLPTLYRAPKSKWDMIVSKMALWFLENRLSLDLIDLKKIYLDQLKSKSLAYPSGVLKIEEIFNAISVFFGSEFLNDLSNTINSDVLLHLKRLLNFNFSKLTFTHPIIHFLMLTFLEIDLERLRRDKDYYKYLPFGRGPWPCLNPVSSHYKENVITNCEVSSAYIKDKPFGTFRCSCGFEYTRIGPDTFKDAVHQYTKIIKCGEIWDRTLINLAKTEGRKLSELSNTFLLGHDFLKKQLQRIEKVGVDMPNTNNYNGYLNGEWHGNNNRALLQIKYRQSWTHLVFRYPDKGRIFLRSLDSKAYYWLSENDREWFNNNSPTKKIISPQRIDWEEKDNRFYRQILEALTKIKNLETDPFRITKASLCKLIQEPISLLKKLEKLPRTNELIFQSIESVEDFHIRRIQYVIKSLIKSGGPISIDIIKRRASIKSDASIKVLDFIESEFKQHL